MANDAESQGRIFIELSDALNEKLKRLATRDAKGDRVSVLRKAIALYESAVEFEKKKLDLAVVDNRGNVIEKLSF